MIVSVIYRSYSGNLSDAAKALNDGLLGGTGRLARYQPHGAAPYIDIIAAHNFVGHAPLFEPDFVVRMGEGSGVVIVEQHRKLPEGKVIDKTTLDTVLGIPAIS
ncbi:hypothetical protein HYU13_00755 [Candidatus Woesearchaeota archaeon]|nr:hypothetical protein [Candidatus Woesearchaeota archaeon]